MNKKFLAALAASIATVLMGAVGLFGRKVSVSGEILTLARYSIGFLCIIFLVTFRDIKKNKVHFSLILNGVCIGLCTLFYIKAARLTTLTNASFLLYLGPLIATLLAYLILSEKITKFGGILIILAFIGSLFILNFDITFDKTNLDGYFYAVLSGIFYSLFIFFNRMIPVEIPTVIRSFYSLLSSSSVIFIILCIRLNGNFSKIIFVNNDLWWLLTFGLIQGGLVALLIAYAVKYLSASEYGTISYLEPLTASFIGIVLYSEIPTLLQTIGCSFILFSGIAQIYMAKINKSRRKTITVGKSL